MLDANVTFCSFSPFVVLIYVYLEETSVWKTWPQTFSKAPLTTTMTLNKTLMKSTPMIKTPPTTNMASKNTLAWKSSFRTTNKQPATTRITLSKMNFLYSRLPLIPRPLNSNFRYFEHFANSNNFLVPNTCLLILYRRKTIFVFVYFITPKWLKWLKCSQVMGPVHQETSGRT
ncbi:uncharacterized protein LOC130635626 [Hydractinia symbiolongicarpus]|uniref:uncharacterized protein LOC130635626 n=1 Tax=Hydractinia symbiolongicarpus TaxID=13093 RepID=UPI00254E11AF|nr:uncharacterized protein LOC130635626 [Hydractinia symbiolongicarpus]